MKTLNLENIEFSKNDLKRGIKIPEVLDEELSYISGFLAGDGCLSFRKNKSEYAIILSGNSKDEKEFYNQVIVPILMKLFNIKIEPKISNRDSTYYIKIESKAIFSFFTKIIGFPIGKKSNKIRILHIFKQNDYLVKSFIQGFADADFCFTLKKRYKKQFYYPVVTCGCASKTMIDDIAFYLNKFGFKFTTYKTVKFDERVNKFETTYGIDLNGYMRVYLWMLIIGFRNFKYITKFEKWRLDNSSNKKITKTLQTLKG